MADQLTSDELRQVLAEWLRPMRPKHRQKILGLAGLFEAVIARAETAEAEAEDAILVASDAAQREENAMHALSHFRARVAELEAQLAAQQWRPVTEKPVVTMQYQVVVQHSRQQPTADHMAYYPSSGWTGTDVIFWRPIPPLPPAPQETTQ